MNVLLLHGWPVSERVWVSQISALRNAGVNAHAPHLYGRGPSIDDWAAQLLRDIDGPLVAVGASMGGYCALALARRAPERVIGMVLVASRADADSFERRKSRLERIFALRDGESPPLAEPDANLEHSERAPVPDIFTLCQRARGAPRCASRDVLAETPQPRFRAVNVERRRKRAVNQPQAFPAPVLRNHPQRHPVGRGVKIEKPSTEHRG